LERVKISAQLNSKEVKEIARSWKQSQPVATSYCAAQQQAGERELKAVATSWNQLKVFTAAACCPSRAQEGMAVRDHACIRCMWWSSCHIK